MRLCAKAVPVWPIWLAVLLGLSACSTAEQDVQTKDTFIESLVSQMTVPEMVMQIFLMFADNIVGPDSDNALYDSALRLVPGAGIGVIHDWYPLNKTSYNDLQRLNLEKSRLKIPFMQASSLQDVPRARALMLKVALSATFDTSIVQEVAGAIGTEARSIGIHACFSPVLDLCQDPRWVRASTLFSSEAMKAGADADVTRGDAKDWGEDQVLTSHMGVAYASGLSKNSSFNQSDAVVPVMKHFAAHGSPQSGINTAPFMGHGRRQVLEQLLVPFKAAVELGGAKGVMMAYNEIDGIPAPVDPMLYDELRDWGYDGFVISDDLGMSQLENVHFVADSPADAISQWLNEGGMISYYDYPLDTYLDSIMNLVANHSVSVSTLQDKMRRILGVKYDLGLFHSPYIADDIDVQGITAQHVHLALEAARKSIVLLENRNSLLPLRPTRSGAQKIALIGPFSDILNYGDYSGPFGQYPTANSSTLRQGLLNILSNGNYSYDLTSAWGANTWLYNAQYSIPGYHLSVNGTFGGLLATYFADTNFTAPLVQKMEIPSRDWGLYPPPGLPSNNFSAIWEGELSVPVSVATDGWIGIALSYNSTAKLFIDGQELVAIPLTTSGNIQSNIPGYKFTLVNSTMAPPGSAPFTFLPGAKHSVRLEFQAWNLYQKIQNANSLNSEVLLFWNLVDRTSPVEKAVSVAQDADLVILAVGANWNSDGENGDRATMGLSANQTALANAILDTGKPVVLVLEGGRPFAIPDLYNRSMAVLNTYFGGQAAGRAIADVLFGHFNPGGRLPLTIPRHVGQIPAYYNYKPSSHIATYVDMDPSPAYPFGYGLSYSNFTVSDFSGRARKTSTAFGAYDTITFSVAVKNTGAMAGSHVPQVYLLGRVSQVTRPEKQLVAFTRVYLEPGESRVVTMDVEVPRYLRILNRQWKWEVERGAYTFALLENGGMFADTSMNVTMQCIG